MFTLSPSPGTWAKETCLPSPPPDWPTVSMNKIHFLLALQPPPLGPWHLIFFRFMIILQTVGLLGRVISSSQDLYLTTGQHKHRINTYTCQTSMPCVGFDPTIPTFSERRQCML
jgi:hypothetical protein